MGRFSQLPSGKDKAAAAAPVSGPDQKELALGWRLPPPPSQEPNILRHLDPHRIRTVAVFLLAGLASLAIAACSLAGGNDEDPEEVLNATFTNEQKIESGTFEISLDVTSEGGSDSGTLEANLGGPFQGGDGGFPSFDIEAEADVDSESQEFSGSIGLTSTGDKAFVNFQDTDYEVPQQAFNEFAKTFNQLQAQSSDQQAGDEGGNLLTSLGINPTNWLSDLDNEGEEDVEGTETIHISGEADVPKLVEDLKQIAENAPQAAERVTPEQLGELDQLTGIVESAELDIYSGADDKLLRKLEASLELNPQEGDEATPESVSVDFAITLSELNEPQQIAAPSGAKPLGDLLGQLGVDPNSLGELGGALGGGSGSGDGASLPQAGGSPDGPSDDASQAYLDCRAQAQGAAAVQECASLLQ